MDGCACMYVGGSKGARGLQGVLPAYPCLAPASQPAAPRRGERALTLTPHLTHHHS